MAEKITTSHAGHGGTDPGACSGNYGEAVIARQINKKWLAITGGVDCTVDNSVSVNDNLAKICQKVNAASKNTTDWNISHHLNAAGGVGTGAEVWYWAGDEPSRVKAAAMSAAIAKALGIPDRGAKPTTSLYVHNNTVGRMLLIEWCFIDRAGDIQALMNKMDAAVKAAASVFGYTGGNTNTPPSSGTAFCQDTVNINNCAAYIRGWNVGSSNNAGYEPWLYFMNPGKRTEIIRFKGTVESRPDVNKLHPNASKDRVGWQFSIGFATSARQLLAGKKVYLMVRWEKAGKYQNEYHMESKQFTMPPAVNAGSLDEINGSNGKVYFKGWHLSNLGDTAYKRFLFLMHKGKEIHRIDITKNTKDRPDVAKAYANKGLLTNKVGFEITTTVPAVCRGKELEMIARYTADPAGNNPIADVNLGKKFTL
ncbi:N-acetylmuramoyl-L-alanine amidase [Enterococcus faecium]|nr:N-acetylmuramoyl-L-alanine amidase [Enterococcus faecium]